MNDKNANKRKMAPKPKCYLCKIIKDNHFYNRLESLMDFFAENK